MKVNIQIKGKNEKRRNIHLTFRGVEKPSRSGSIEVIRMKLLTRKITFKILFDLYVRMEKNHC